MSVHDDETLDMMFSEFGWYKIIRNKLAGAGKELRIEFVPHDPKALESLGALMAGGHVEQFKVEIGRYQAT